MDNLQIIKQLLNGNHLSESELKQAETTLNFLNREYKTRKMDKVNELTASYSLNQLQDLKSSLLKSYTEEEIKQAVNLKLEKINKAPFFVTMIDKFMSGWGKAYTKDNKLIVACYSMKEAESIKDNASKRPEMKYINICVNKPQIKNHQHPSWKHFEDMGSIWKQ